MQIFIFCENVPSGKFWIQTEKNKNNDYLLQICVHKYKKAAILLPKPQVIIIKLLLWNASGEGNCLLHLSDLKCVNSTVLTQNSLHPHYFLSNLSNRYVKKVVEKPSTLHQRTVITLKNLQTEHFSSGRISSNLINWNQRY